MSEELKGEWKLLKVWECHKCKALIKDGRKVFDHKCDIKENELIVDEKIIEDQKRTIEDQKITIDDQKRTIEDQKITTDDQKRTIEDQKRTIEGRDTIIEGQKKATEDQKSTIESQKSTIESQKSTIESQKSTIESQKGTIERQKNTIENRNKFVEEQKKTIKSRDEVIEYQRKAIEEYRNVTKEKVINNNIPKINIEDGSKRIENNNEQICIDIWKPGCRIKDSKDAGYREDIEIEVFERGKEKKRVIIKNGKVIKRPDGIDILGKYSSEGFIVKGIYRNEKILNV